MAAVVQQVRQVRARVRQQLRQVMVQTVTYFMGVMVAAEVVATLARRASGAKEGLAASPVVVGAQAGFACVRQVRWVLLAGVARVVTGWSS